MLALIAPGTVSAGSGARDIKGALTSGGIERTYIAHLPEQLDAAKPVPLVILLHGGGGRAKHMLKLTKGGFNALADSEGFITVYPNGYGKTWNDGRNNESIEAQKKKIDDVRFIADLIDDLAKRYPVDRSRVFAAGLSNGGKMSMRLALALPDRIAAIGVVAASYPEDLPLEPSEGKAVPAVFINGTEDPISPFKGGEVRVFRKKFGKVLPARKTAILWAALNDCTAAPISTKLPDTARDGTTVTLDEYRDPAGTVKVRLYTITGGGHTWPSGLQYLPKRMVGRTTRDIDANKVVWEFFEQTSMTQELWTPILIVPPEFQNGWQYSIQND